MQLVKHVLEDLARFNPEARMEPEIEMGSLSPATECNVTIPGEESDKEKMGEEYSNLEEENSDLKKELENHKKLWGEVKELLSSFDMGAEEIVTELQEVSDRAAQI